MVYPFLYYKIYATIYRLVINYVIGKACSSDRVYLFSLRFYAIIEIAFIQLFKQYAHLIMYREVIMVRSI